MLVQFRFSNFRSFREEAELSFVAATNLKYPSGFGVTKPEGSKRELVNVLGLFGANASGKTNVLNALRFMRYVVDQSHRSWSPEDSIPIEPFRLDAASASQPSRFQLDLIVDRIPMQYGFALTRSEVCKEWLFAWPGGKQQLLFERTGLASIKFGRGLKGPNETIYKLTRNNSLFLSAAAQNNHEHLKPLYTEIIQKIRFLSPDDELSRRHFTMTSMSEGHKEGIKQLVKLADLGIIDLEVKEKEVVVPPKVRAVVLRIIKEMGASPDAIKQPPEGGMRGPHLVFTHASGHTSAGVTFGAEDESRGTLTWFALVGPIVQALAEGSVLLADEIDSSLHEILQGKVIQLFNDPRCNPHGAQLVFTSQNTTVLGDALTRGEQDDEVLLRRDQIWLTEKKQGGLSVLVPLTDFHVRKGENIQRWYLRGRFGAVPILDERLLECASATPNHEVSDHTEPL